MEKLFNSLIKLGVFEKIDFHFAECITDISNENNAVIKIASALVSKKLREGNICIELNNAGRELANYIPDLDEDQFLNAMSEALCESEIVGSPGDVTPLILDKKNRLYLYRYWKYQEDLAKDILQRLQVRGTHKENDESKLEMALSRLFPSGNVDEEPDLQKIGARTAYLRNICVISGGPGTGKTTTVAKILALLVELMNIKEDEIVLCAPTGKAAGKLGDAIAAAKQKINASEDVLARIPEAASTIHRLLGYRNNSVRFFYNKNNKLDIKVIVVDEASMIDLSMMSKLLEAVPQDAKIIFLGDKDQLASVEAGSVLSDICAAAAANIELENSVVFLTKSYRFSNDSGIGQISRMISNGEIGKACDLITSGKYEDLLISDFDPSSVTFHEKIVAGFKKYLQIISIYGPERIAEIFNSFDNFRILCALREGPTGINFVNHKVENILETAGLKTSGNWYVGKPIMITVNDYSQNLFNGDVGLIMRDPVDNTLKAYFQSNEKNKYRKLQIQRLPQHETAYAMTVHKSQGSEFNKVLFILPEREESLVLSRELTYTAITRAKEQLEINGSVNVFKRSLTERISRISGLMDELIS